MSVAGRYSTRWRDGRIRTGPSPTNVHSLPAIGDRADREGDQISAPPPRLRVLVFADYYLPGFRAGGPLRSITNLMEALSENYEFKIVTRDHDFGGPRYAGVPAGQWLRVGRHLVRYTSWRHRMLPWVLRSFLRDEEADLIYLNSFFSPAFTIPILLLRRFNLERRNVVLAPRGELFPNALALKPLRKRLFLRIARRLRLYQGVTFQASSDLERLSIENWFDKAKISVAQILVAPDIGASAGDHQPTERAAGPLRVAFLSRVCRVKNLHSTLEALQRVRSTMTLDIYGPIDDPQYWSECEAIAEAVPSHVTVDYKGAVPPASVPSVLHGYDLLVLPSLSENFGHVILEALLSGCGVLISDRTPWQDIEQHGVGAVIPPTDVAAQARWLDHFASLTEHDLAELRSAALGYAARVMARRHEIVEQNRLMFARAATRLGDA